MASVKMQCSGPYIVMVCADMSEAGHVGQQLSEVNSGCLVTYRRLDDLLVSEPAGKVALVILATNDPPNTIRRMLRWLRNHWRNCPIAVVGDQGGGEMEMATREGAAMFLTRPVPSEYWSAIVQHALKEEIAHKSVIARES